MRDFPDLDADAPEVSARELKRRIDAGEEVTVLDTRRPDDYGAWHLTGPSVRTVNVPFTAFLAGDGGPVGELPPAVPDGPVVTVCAEGISSRYVAELLHREGRVAETLEDGMEGWARLYETHEIPCEAATVFQYHRPSSGCLAYMVVADGEAVVVDPLRAFVERYERDALGHDATVVAAVDTHVHADHVSGVRALADLTGADAVVPAGSEDRGLDYDAPYRTVDDGDVFAVGDVPVEATALPGHTTEMTGYRVGDLHFTGDTVFLHGVARPDLEAGDEGAPDAARQLHETVERLDALSDDHRLAPGHAAAEATEPPGDASFTATVADLRDDLELFGETDRERFVDRITGQMPPRPANFRDVIAVNLGERDADAREAFAMELGPNNCAASD